MRVLHDCGDIPNLNFLVVEAFPSVVTIHSVRYVMSPMRILSLVFNHREKSVLWSFEFNFCLPLVLSLRLLLLHLHVLRCLRVEDTHSDGRAKKFLVNFQDFIKLDEIFHLNQPVSVDKALQVQTQNHRQLLNQLFMPSPYLTAILHVVIDILIIEVRV